MTDVNKFCKGCKCLTCANFDCMEKTKAVKGYDGEACRVCFTLPLPEFAKKYRNADCTIRIESVIN